MSLVYGPSQDSVLAGLRTYAQWLDMPLSLLTSMLLKMAASEHASALQCALIRSPNTPDDGVARLYAPGTDKVRKAMQQYRARARGTVSRCASDPSPTED